MGLLARILPRDSQAAGGSAEGVHALSLDIFIRTLMGRLLSFWFAFQPKKGVRYLETDACLASLPGNSASEMSSSVRPPFIVEGGK